MTICTITAQAGQNGNNDMMIIIFIMEIMVTLVEEDIYQGLTDSQDGNGSTGGSGTGKNIRDYTFRSWTLTPGLGGTSVAKAMVVEAQGTQERKE